MKKIAIRFFHLISYLVFRLGEGLVRLLPIEVAFVMGRIGGEIAFRLLGRRRDLALTNLRLAFVHDKSEADLQKLNREHFQLLGANLLAGIKASTMPHEKIWKRVTANIPQERAQSGWIALISHTGNWELYSHLGQKYPEYRFGSVYQPLKNPFIDRHVRAARTNSGITLFDRRTQLLSCVRFLREGGVVGVLSDQGAGYAGVWMPLFGRLTSCSTLAARLALRAGLPLVPIAIATTGLARWELKFSELIFPGDHDPEFLTAQMNRVLEEQIRSSPADWLWAHNRWKPLRPHILFARDQRSVFLPRDFDLSRLDPFRVLIVSPHLPEDVVAAFPAVHAIKEGRPDNHVAVLTKAALRERWKENTAVDEIISWQSGESSLALGSRIRQTARFDVAIFLEADSKLSIAVFRAGIPLRIGLSRGLNTWLCQQHPAEPEPSLDAARRNLHIARSLGANVNEPLARV
ncbi:MAG TPA: hypothetical protein VGG94_02115 [Chthoniobacterales bacterium]